MEFMQSNRIDSGQNDTGIGGDGTADAALNTEGSSEGDSEDEWYRNSNYHTHLNA
jgi:transcription elongation factor